MHWPALYTLHNIYFTLCAGLVPIIDSAHVYLIYPLRSKQRIGHKKADTTVGSTVLLAWHERSFVLSKIFYYFFDRFFIHGRVELINASFLNFKLLTIIREMKSPFFFFDYYLKSIASRI